MRGGIDSVEAAKKRREMGKVRYSAGGESGILLRESVRAAIIATNAVSTELAGLSHHIISHRYRVPA